MSNQASSRCRKRRRYLRQRRRQATSTPSATPSTSRGPFRVPRLPRVPRAPRVPEPSVGEPAGPDWSAARQLDRQVGAHSPFPGALIGGRACVDAASQPVAALIAARHLQVLRIFARAKAIAGARIGTAVRGAGSGCGWRHSALTRIRQHMVRFRRSQLAGVRPAPPGPALISARTLVCWPGRLQTSRKC
jgi:hypothetical protein